MLWLKTIGVFVATIFSLAIVMLYLGVETLGVWSFIPTVVAIGVAVWYYRSEKKPRVPRGDEGLGL